MGNTLSSWGGQKRVASLIDKAGLPLQIDNSTESDTKRDLSRFTRAYDAPGWFTGVKSTVTVPATPEVIYKSLSKDLHEVFTPMSECHDENIEESSDGKQHIFRIVRIPFKVAFVTGNLKLRLNVTNNPTGQQITFESAQAGRLITKFIADFKITKHEDDKSSTVELDSKVDAKSLPPPPFKNMVKDVMVNKMDSCMVDLVEFHKKRASEEEEFVDAEESLHSSATHQGELPAPRQEAEPQQASQKEAESKPVPRPEAESKPAMQTPAVRYEEELPAVAPAGPSMGRQDSQGFEFKQRRRQEHGGILAAIRRSLGANLPQRRSFEMRRSMEKRRQMRQRQGAEQQQAMQRMASASALHGLSSQPEAAKPPQPPRPAAQGPAPANQGSSSQASVFEQWQTARAPSEAS